MAVVDRERQSLHRRFECAAPRRHLDLVQMKSWSLAGTRAVPVRARCVQERPDDPRSYCFHQMQMGDAASVPDVAVLVETLADERGHFGLQHFHREHHNHRGVTLVMRPIAQLVGLVEPRVAGGRRTTAVGECAAVMPHGDEEACPRHWNLADVIAFPALRLAHWARRLFLGHAEEPTTQHRPPPWSRTLSSAQTAAPGAPTAGFERAASSRA